MMASLDGVAKKDQIHVPSAQSGVLNICLFGGTFDPTHLGHTHIAAVALKVLGLDRVIFLPCKQSPHKTGKNHTSAHHRLAMCQLATKDFNWAEVDQHDLAAPAPSYSWVTAEAMAVRFPGARLFWLMGSDQWEVITQWDRSEHLSSLVEFIVFSRGGAPLPRAGYRLHSIAGDHPASARAIRKSARTHLKTDWLDPKVSQYITKHALYIPDPPDKR